MDTLPTPPTPDELLAALTPTFSTKWPLPRQRWTPEAKANIGVYALIWKNHAYLGMTVSKNGFQGRWARHHRSLFILKRANSTTKAFRTFIKTHELTPQDFTLLALRTWPNPGEDLSRDLTEQIAQTEQEEYDRLETLGYTMLNNVRPRGTGYERSTGRSRKKRRRRRTPTQKVTNRIK